MKFSLLNDDQDPNDPHSLVHSERRIDRKARILQWAAALCAMFAAVGIGHGLHMGNPNDGWVLPIFAGVVAAVVLAALWHVMVGAVIGMVRTTTITALFIGAMVLTVVAVSTSAQAIATAISGRSAVAAELTQLVDSYGQSLNEAYAQSTIWRGVQAAAEQLAAGLRGQAKSEAGGGNGTGKGCGPLCTSMLDMAGSFQNGADAMAALLQQAADIQAQGEEAMGRMRIAAANGDQPGFMAAAEEVASAIAKLNAIDPKPIIASTGAVVASEKGIKGLSEETADFYKKADVALADRHSVDAPEFRPLTTGEAVRKQMFGSAMHGWLLAAAIDVLPLLILVIAFVLSREVWLHEEVAITSLTTKGRNERDRRKVKDMTNNIVRLPHAAE